MPFPKRPSLERFESKIERDDRTGCWNWTAAVDKNGYGVFADGLRPNGRVASTRAHRWSYERFVGPIPADQEIDHLCRNHACVNPEHLEAVTPYENQRRGVGTFVVTERAKTHCPYEHPYDERNTYVTSQGWRVCRECKRRRSAAAREAAKTPRAA